MIFINWDIVYIDDISEAEYNETYSLLSPSRRARVDALKSVADKKRTLAGEFLTRKILNKCGIKSPIITVSESGKPVLNCGLHFNISHSQNAVVCAVSDTDIGIDIEKIRPVKHRLIERVCNTDELNYVLDTTTPHTLCGDSEALKRFFEIWTSKEAYFKKYNTKIKSFKDINTLRIKKQIIKHNDFIICII